MGAFPGEAQGRSLLWWGQVQPGWSLSGRQSGINLVCSAASVVVLTDTPAVVLFVSSTLLWGL